MGATGRRRDGHALACREIDLKDDLVDIWQNTRSDRVIAEMGLTKGQSLHLKWLNAEEDMTDSENVHFWYSV